MSWACLFGRKWLSADPPVGWSFHYRIYSGHSAQNVKLNACAYNLLFNEMKVNAHRDICAWYSQSHLGLLTALWKATKLSNIKVTTDSGCRICQTFSWWMKIIASYCWYLKYCQISNVTVLGKRSVMIWAQCKRTGICVNQVSIFEYTGYSLASLLAFL